jgi:hypothetical protein
MSRGRATSRERTNPLPDLRIYMEIPPGVGSVLRDGLEPSHPSFRTDDVFQRTVEIRNVVSKAPFLVEHPSAHPARADLRRMRHARGRTQGLVLDPPRPGRDGAKEGRGAVAPQHFSPVVASRGRSACLAAATHPIEPSHIEVRLPHERDEPRTLRRRSSSCRGLQGTCVEMRRSGGHSHRIPC